VVSVAVHGFFPFVLPLACFFWSDSPEWGGIHL
jgi:hypothetical protein